MGKSDAINRGFSILLGLVLILVVFGLYNLKTTIYAQSPAPQKKLSKTEKRLNTLDYYQKSSVKFKTLKGETEQKTVTLFQELLNKSVEEGKKCRENLDQQTSEQRKRCDDSITDAHLKAKEIYRLLKYYQLKAGTPNMCIKADMGVEKHLKAKGISNPDIFYRIATGGANPDNPKETGRTKSSTVFICNGADGKNKLRIQAANGKYVKLTPEDLARPELKISELPPKENVETLQKNLGLIN